MKFSVLLPAIILFCCNCSAQPSSNEPNANTFYSSEGSAMQDTFSGNTKPHTNSVQQSNSFIAKKNANTVTVNPSLWRGANLPLTVNEKLKTQLSQSHFDYAAKAGANVIRLSLYVDSNFSFLSQKNAVSNVNKVPFINKLKQAVAMANNANLKLIIDLHKNPGTRDGKIWLDKKYWDVITNLWYLLAKTFKDDSTIVAFDLMNEPNIKKVLPAGQGDAAKMFKGTWKVPDSWKGSAKDYFLLMKGITKAIREADANRWVIVEGFGYLGNPVNFNWMQPLEGYDKVIYSFHMYEPTGLTMLGTKSRVSKGKGEDVRPFNLSTDEKRIDKAFAPVLAFQKKYNVPIFVGEFGITDKAINGKDANGNSYNGACWLSTVIKKMDQYGWGWTYWDFWTKVRKPDSEQDPRYIILSAAMKGQPVDNYCK